MRGDGYGYGCGWRGRDSVEFWGSLGARKHGGRVGGRTRTVGEVVDGTLAGMEVNRFNDRAPICDASPVARSL